MILSVENDEINMCVDGYQIKNRSHKELLGVTIDSKLSFDAHISNLCRKASLKLHALARISPYMDMDQEVTSSMHLFPLNLDTVL